MVIDSGVTVLSCQFWKWEEKLNVLFSGWVGKITCLVWQWVHWELLSGWILFGKRESQKPLWAGEEPGDHWGGKITFLVRKWITYKLCAWENILYWYIMRIKMLQCLCGCVQNTKILDKRWRKSSKRSRDNNEIYDNLKNPYYMNEHDYINSIPC